MPILPSEPDLFPADFWSRGPLAAPEGSRHEERDEAQEPDDTPRWWCLHTKPRQEKTTARYLRAHGLAHYLPQVAQESRTPRGRKIRSIVPLFPSYVFLHGDRQARLASFQGNTLVKVLDVADQARLDRDLRQIHRLVTSGMLVVPEPHHPVGTRVRIVDGPFAGLIGVVERRAKGDRFVAMVDFLRQGAAIELRDWQVEPLEEST